MNTTTKAKLSGIVISAFLIGAVQAADVVPSQGFTERT